MRFQKQGWLRTLLDEALAGVRSGAASGSGRPRADFLRSARAEARAHLRRCLRDAGRLYGTPAERTEAAKRHVQGPERALFLAVVQTLARMGCELAEHLGVAEQPRSEQLLCVFAVVVGELDEAVEIDRQLQGGEAVSRRSWARIEAALSRRALAFSGDPAFGLLLHNGAIYVDAHVFGRQAIDLFTRAALNRDAAQRRLEFAARQKALLVEVLTALACADHLPGSTGRRTILRQLEKLGLPEHEVAALRASVKLAFARKRPLSSVVRPVRSVEVRRFLLEQTLLACLVEGRRTTRERAFLLELASTLRMSSRTLEQLEVKMAEFYLRHRDVVDVFTASGAATLAGEELVDGISRTIEKNFRSLMTEVRETGELSVLLARAVRGQKLTSEERKRMRAQLIDLAKVVPALAIFAAPGGLLLLIAAAKLLKINLLPSAFQDEASEEPGALATANVAPSGEPPASIPKTG